MLEQSEERHNLPVPEFIFDQGEEHNPPVRRGRNVLPFHPHKRTEPLRSGSIRPASRAREARFQLAATEVAAGPIDLTRDLDWQVKEIKRQAEELRAIWGIMAPPRRVKRPTEKPPLIQRRSASSMPCQGPDVGTDRSHPISWPQGRDRAGRGRFGGRLENVRGSSRTPRFEFVPTLRPPLILMGIA